MLKNLNFKQLVTGIFLGFLLLYAIIEAGLYYVLGLRAIYWHTHIMVYVYVAVIFYFTMKRLVFRNNAELFAKSWSYFKIVSITLLVFECLFMLFARDKRVIQQYPAFYESKREHYYHVWTKDHWLETAEFKYFRKLNAASFSDREWPLKKKENTIRVLCIGDSFTEGDGAHVDSSYVAFLRRQLKEKYQQVEVMNAGACGSDPYFYYVNLRDRLLKYQPDIVVMTLSANDMNWDIKIRGGMERFQSNGKVKYKSPPWWEPIYAVSCVSRIFFRIVGYNSILQKPSEIEDQKDRSELIQLYKETEGLALKDDFKVIIAFLPSVYEIRENTNEYDFSEIVDSINKMNSFEIIDLKERYSSYIKKNQLNLEDVFWPKDGHHNARGYEMMAKSILPEVSQYIDSVRIQTEINP